MQKVLVPRHQRAMAQQSKAMIVTMLDELAVSQRFKHVSKTVNFFTITVDPRLPKIPACRDLGVLIFPGLSFNYRHHATTTRQPTKYRGRLPDRQVRLSRPS